VLASADVGRVGDTFEGRLLWARGGAWRRTERMYVALVR
jgi:hypothetical protein